VAELRKSAQRRTADAKRRGSIGTVGTVPTPSSARRVDFGRFANVCVGGAPVGRSRDSDGASSTQSFGGDGAADAKMPAKRVNNGPPTMGSESHRVTINAATILCTLTFRTVARLRAWQSSGRRQRCASGLSATKAQTTSALLLRLLALVTFAPPFVRTPTRQAKCILATRHTPSLRLLGTRATA
jgi:hypothetical protein